MNPLPVQNRVNDPVLYLQFHNNKARCSAKFPLTTFIRWAKEKDIPMKVCLSGSIFVFKLKKE